MKKVIEQGEIKYQDGYVRELQMGSRGDILIKNGISMYVGGMWRKLTKGDIVFIKNREHDISLKEVETYFGTLINRELW